MTRALSYKGPSKLIVHQTTAQRQDDTGRGTPWTRSEVAWLKENYETVGAVDAGHYLRRSTMAVRIKMSRIRHREKTRGAA